MMRACSGSGMLKAGVTGQGGKFADKEAAGQSLCWLLDPAAGGHLRAMARHG